MKVHTPNKRPTGIAQSRKGKSVTLRTRSMRVGEKSNVSVSTSARSSNARVATRATEKNIAVSSSSASSAMPVAPRVDIGPKAYKVYPNGDRLVIRFSVANGLIRRRGRYYRTPQVFVYDMDTGKAAAKTSKTGYADRKEAIRVAREYRDKYGPYVRFVF